MQCLYEGFPVAQLNVAHGVATSPLTSDALSGGTDPVFVSLCDHRRLK